MREPCRRLVSAVGAGRLDATTTVEVIQELVHVRARRRTRADAARQGRAFAQLLAPLLRPAADDLLDGLALFQAQPGLGAFEAVLAAAAISRGPEAFVSAHRAFEGVHGLPYRHPTSPELAQLVGE